MQVCLLHYYLHLQVLQLCGNTSHAPEVPQLSPLTSSCQDAKPPDVNEILLLDSQGGVLEGMSSNVFVVTDGRVVTPDKGILVGTVRNLVLEVGTADHNAPMTQPAQARSTLRGIATWVHMTAAGDHICSSCVESSCAVSGL
jgi:Amino-transferase class IV